MCVCVCVCVCVCLTHREGEDEEQRETQGVGWMFLQCSNLLIKLLVVAVLFLMSFCG